MNVGPYVPLLRRAAERRCYLKYIAVDGLMVFSAGFTPGHQKEWEADHRCPGLAGGARGLSHLLSFPHSVVIVSVLVIFVWLP